MCKPCVKEILYSVAYNEQQKYIPKTSIRFVVTKTSYF